MQVDVKEEFLNPYGFVHGGILFGIADSVSGALACMTGKAPVTTSASMNYLSSCKGNKIIAEATALKVGHNIGYYDVKIYDEEKKLVAQANVNMYLKDYEKK
jgi:acyl-CoA thioesterase